MSKSSYSEGKQDYNEEDESFSADSKTEAEFRTAEEKPSYKQVSDEELLEKLQKFFYEDETLANHFERFIDDHSYIVDLSNEEYKLEYTKVFNEYKSLFEQKMEDFIHENLRVTIQDIYNALKRKVESEEESMEAFFAQVLIAVTDFDVFMGMMKDSARKQQPRK